MPAAYSQQLPKRMSLRIDGNVNDGYSAVVLHDSQPVVHRRSEIYAVFQNGERSLEDRLDNWKASSWTGDDLCIHLAGAAHLKNTDATVHIEITYEVISSDIVRRTVRVRQSDMFLLHYQLTDRIEPSQYPAKLWSFDQPDCHGGPLREYFPAAGFRTGEGLTVGLLTDAGFRNGWSRMFRRDGKPIKPAPAEIPDPSLFCAASRAEQQQGKHFIALTFGEELCASHDGPKCKPVLFPPVSQWKTSKAAELRDSSGILELTMSSSSDSVIAPWVAVPGTIYAIEFEYRAGSALGVALWDADSSLKLLLNFTQFNDRIPAVNTEWASFRSTVFIPSLHGTTAALVLSLPELLFGNHAGSASTLALNRAQLRDLKITPVAAHTRPYHHLEMDKPLERTTFLFADAGVSDTIGGYRFASQIKLSEALNFKGGETEKVLYADLMMLCWSASTTSVCPMLAPSIYYSAAGEMYLRDSFFALNGIHNRALNEQVCSFWAENQGEDGAINTLIEPEMTNLERKSNDSTPLWLMWVLLNRRRFGTTMPEDKVRKAAEYCLRTYDPAGDGACIAQFAMGQLDIVAYPEGVSTLCQNQGLLAVTLRCIQELMIPGLSESLKREHIANAESLYRSYYDPTRKFLLPARGMTDAIGFAELFPEFLSLWLFNKKILTGEMVLNHLDRIPVMLPRADAPFPAQGGTVRPVFIGLSDTSRDWRFFTAQWHPMASDSYASSYLNHEMDGIYYNGGSWMRIEICAYVVGKLHGWPSAEEAIHNRLWAETHIDPDFPTSQEYLPTDPAHPLYGSHRVFAWNSFVLQALEVAGMRKVAMDPDWMSR